MPELKSGWGAALTVTHFLLCVVVALYARRDRSHTPILVFIAGFFLADRLRSFTSSVLDSAAAPYQGFDLVTLHVDRLLYLAGAYGFAWLCAHMFACGIGKRAAWLGFALVYIALVVTYPISNQRVQATIFNASEVFSLLICWFAAFRAALGSADVKPDFGHLVVFVLLAADSVAILVGYLDNRIVGVGTESSMWASIMATTFLAYLVCVALYGARLLGPSSSDSGKST